MTADEAERIVQALRNAPQEGRSTGELMDVAEAISTWKATAFALRYAEQAPPGQEIAPTSLAGTGG